MRVLIYIYAISVKGLSFLCKHSNIFYLLLLGNGWSNMVRWYLIVMLTTIVMLSFQVQPRLQAQYCIPYTLRAHLLTEAQE